MPSEFPKCYEAVELAEIARALGRQLLTPFATHCLQEALAAYQWASLMDHYKDRKNSLFDTNHERRRRLKKLMGLIRLKSSSEEI